MSRRIDYGTNKYPAEKLPVGLDFTKSSPELVNLDLNNSHNRARFSNIQLGSYMPQNNLQRILHKDKKDFSFYAALDATCKNNKQRASIRSDITDIQQFFSTEFTFDIYNYILKIIDPIVECFTEKYNKRLTPRKRRTYILAVVRSFSRRKGRKFTKELLEDINKSFNYFSRQIRFGEVCTAENDLINWKFLPKQQKLSQSSLQQFNLNLVHNLNRLRKDPIIAANQDFNNILLLTKNFIMNIATDEIHKKSFLSLMEHYDKDFFSRLLIWTIAKAFAARDFNYYLKKPDSPGWLTLFLVDSMDQHQIPIRSLKYIFWTEFSFRKQLKECQMYPEEFA